MVVTKEMKIGEILRAIPESPAILMGFGLGCIGCPSAQAETIEEACYVHRMDVDELVSALNAKANN